MADICEEQGGLDRVRRVLATAMAETRQALHDTLLPDRRARHSDTLEKSPQFTFRLAHHPHPDSIIYIREKIHEYAVARVMADRCSDIIPGCAPVWRERADTALSQLRDAAAHHTLRPGIRPLCPL